MAGFKMKITEEQVEIAKKLSHPVTTVTDTDGNVEYYATIPVTSKKLTRLIAINDMMSKLKEEGDAISSEVLKATQDYLAAGNVKLDTENGDIDVTTTTRYDLDDIVESIYRADPNSRFIEIKPVASTTLKNTVKKIETEDPSDESIGESIEDYLKDPAADADVVIPLEECDLSSKSVKAILKGKVKTPNEAATAAILAIAKNNSTEIEDLLKVDDFKEQYSVNKSVKIKITSIENE